MTGEGFLSAGLGGVAGFDPVLFAALVLVGVLVAYGRQLTDGPRRGVSVEVRAVGYYLGGLVGQEGWDGGPAGEPDRARQVPSFVGFFRENFQQYEIVTAVDLRPQVFAAYGLHDAPLRFSALARGMEYEEWDLPLRLCLVVVVGRVHLDHLLPEAGLLFAAYLLRPHVHLAVSDLDRDGRVGHQVQVPGGVCRRAAFRGDKHEILPIHDVEERRRALLAALPPDSVQQEDGALAHTAE